MTRLLAPLIKPLAGAWARRRTQRRPSGTPHDTLRDLLTRAQNTRYGKAYGFADVLRQPDLFAAFQQRVPVLDYDTWVQWLGARSPLAAAGVQPLVDEAWPGRVDMFCLSSGTTSGRTKFVPYSAEMASINRKAAIDFFAHLLADQPGQAPLLSQTLYMAGSTNLARDENGVLAGDMSALTKYLAPRLLDRLTQPPPEVASLEPWERRLNALVDICCSGKAVGAISGIPIWQLTLLEAVAARSGRSIEETMPHLRFLIHGGMAITPYRAKIEALAGPRVTTVEVYAASEIGIGAFQVPGEQGMRFQHHYGVFYEFEDDQGKLHGYADLEVETPYRVVVSSCSGLWRYRIGDVLIFRSVNPLVLDRVGRDKTTSAFDEKVTEQELQRAMMAVTPSFADFSLGPDIETRRHVWFLIGEHQPDAAWADRLDQGLRGENQDYDDYRGDGRINPPRLVMVPQRGTFLEAIGRAEGGQRKFPRLLSPEEVQTLLDTFG
ncbi:GH3 family domain-containing protein [Acanthopleuribacter pedis]|uniref:GH3 auxin-responsive promoter family protein n=1 Tax=Acanthopleuribacter pedis TaxID=442870 RepID=A0A8J7U8F9_9BACT|nr:GH3 auxin-responsive promoter family protein [Acanthopleuribacter pedis]MBO1322506.1 GH3 auxin-responsive promoter family protein [Acanthopleuribacter pedis]